jgi:hypothetical protein
VDVAIGRSDSGKHRGGFGVQLGGKCVARFTGGSVEHDHGHDGTDPANRLNRALRRCEKRSRILRAVLAGTAIVAVIAVVCSLSIVTAPLLAAATPPEKHKGRIDCAAKSEVARVAPQRLDGGHQRPRFARVHPDVSEHLLVEGDGGILDGRPA